MSAAPRHEDVKNYISENAPVQESLITPAPVTGNLSQHNGGDDWIKVTDDSESHPTSSSVNVQVQQPTPSAEAPVLKVVQFIPKFKMAAEMEARRRLRMAARRGPGAAVAPPPVIDSSSSSEDEAVPIIVDSSSEGEAEQGSMDEGDEFDP
jgi:hypothetical protein